MATVSAPLSLVWLSVHANHPQLVTEPEAAGVHAWQTSAKALCLYSQSPQACKHISRALTWLTTVLVEWNALHTILAPEAWQTLPVTIPLLSIKDLFSTRVGPAEDDLPLYK